MPAFVRRKAFTQCRHPFGVECGIGDILWRKKLFRGLTQHFRFGPAKHVVRADVPARDFSTHIHADDRVIDRAIQNLAVQGVHAILLDQQIFALHDGAPQFELHHHLLGQRFQHETLFCIQTFRPRLCIESAQRAQWVAIRRN